MRGEGSQMRMKKNAFQSKIRKQWLSNYFTQKRLSLMHAQKVENQQQQKLFQKFNTIITTLPSSSSIDMIIVQFQQNRTVLLSYLRQNLTKLSDKMRQVSYKGLNMYILLLDSLVLCYPEKSQQVLGLCLRGVISQGRRLMREQRMLGHAIIKNLIELILILSPKFSLMDQLLITDITHLLPQSLQLIQYSTPGDDFHHNYILTLRIINQFLISSVKGVDNQQQQQQNFYQSQQSQLDYMKQLLINKLFLQHSHVINLIIKTLSMHNDDQKVVEVTLKVLTNLTYYSNDPSIYQLILSSDIQYLTFSILQTFANKQEIFILLIRFLNNVLLYNKQATEQILENLPFKVMINMFNREKHGKVTLVEELCEVLSHLVCFMDDNQAVISYLMNKGVVEVFIYGLEHVQKDSIISQILFNFPFLLKTCKSLTSQKIRQHAHAFRKVAVQSNQQQNQQMANFILQQAYQQSTIQCSQQKELQQI